MFGESMNYDMTMNWLDFGFHKSKVNVTTGPNKGKKSVLGPELCSYVSGSTFNPRKKTYLSKFEVQRSKAKYTTLPNMGKITVLVLELHSVYQVATFVRKNLLKIWRVKSEGH